MPPLPPNLRQLLRRALTFRCPACGHGRIFSGTFNVAPECTFCWLPFHREAGYFIAAMYLNFFLAASLVTVIYILFRLLFSNSYSIPFPVWFAIAIPAVLLTLRHARALWLALDYFLEPWPPSPPS